MAQMDELYDALRAADRDGRTKDVARLSEYILELDNAPVVERETAVDAPQDDEAYRMASDGLNTFDKTMIGMGRGLTNTGRAVQDGFYRATGNGDALDRLNARIEGERGAWDTLAENSTAASVGEVLGEVAATAPLGGIAGAGAKGLLLKAAPKAGALAKGAVLAAADGGVSAGVLQRGGIEERASAGAEGAAWGVGTAGVLGAVGNIGRRVSNSGKNFATETGKRADDLAEATGIPIHLTDARTDLPFLQKVEGIVNDIPFFGTAGGKIKQNKASQRAVEDIVTRHGFETVGDADDALASAIKDTFSSNQATKGNLYSSFWDELDRFGPVPRGRTNAYITDIMEKEVKANGVGSPHSKLLRQILDTEDGSASTLHRQFQQVRSKATAGKNSGGIDKFTAGEMEGLASAMKADAADYAKVIDATGEAEVNQLAKKLGDADNYYIKNILPFKENKVLKAALNSNETEKILRELNVGGGSKERTRVAYNALNKEGKERMQSAFLLDAYKRSITGDVFSPKTFKSHIDKLDRTTGVLFKGEDAAVFKQLGEILEFTQNSAQAASNPMNGSRMVMASLLGGTLAGSASLALNVSGAAALFKVATQTKAGRRLLTASAKRTANTKAVDFTVDYLGKYTGRMLALDQAVEDTPE